jgi:hypothetical protein
MTPPIAAETLELAEKASQMTGCSIAKEIEE